MWRNMQFTRGKQPVQKVTHLSKLNNNVLLYSCKNNIIYVISKLAYNTQEKTRHFNKTRAHFLLSS